MLLSALWTWIPADIRGPQLGGEWVLSQLLVQILGPTVRGLLRKGHALGRYLLLSLTLTSSPTQLNYSQFGVERGPLCQIICWRQIEIWTTGLGFFFVVTVCKNALRRLSFLKKRNKSYICRSLWYRAALVVCTTIQCLESASVCR